MNSLTTPLALAGAAAGVGWFYLGKVGAALAIAAILFLWFQFGPKPVPKPDPKLKPAPPGVDQTLSKFHEFVKSITKGKGGASSKNIVVSIGNLADTRGLWAFDWGDFESVTTVSPATIADFCRQHPKDMELGSIPGVGKKDKNGKLGKLAQLFDDEGYSTVDSLLKKFCSINNITSRSKPLTKVLDDYFDWVKSVHPGIKPNFHTVVHCTAALADAIEMIDLTELNGNFDGEKYKQSVSQSTAETIKDFLHRFDRGRGQLGRIWHKNQKPDEGIKGIGPAANGAFNKEGIFLVEDLLDKFATFL